MAIIWTYSMPIIHKEMKSHYRTLFLFLVDHKFLNLPHTPYSYKTRISEESYGSCFLLIPSQECCMAILLSQIVFIEEQAAGIGKR